MAGGADRKEEDVGFWLCYLHLRNVKGFGWNHKRIYRIYRIYRELELNMGIKPRKRLQREKPEPLTVPESPNEVWSMDFMADQLVDGRSFRTLNVLDDFTLSNQRIGYGADIRFNISQPPQRETWTKPLLRQWRLFLA